MPSSVLDAPLVYTLENKTACSLTLPTSRVNRMPEVLPRTHAVLPRTHDLHAEDLPSSRSRPSIRVDAFPPQWLPILLAISMSPSTQTPLALSINADHPGAKVGSGVGEFPDAKVIIIEDPGVLADHAEEQRRSLAAFPSPKPSPSPETEVGPSNPLQGRGDVYLAPTHTYSPGERAH